MSEVLPGRREELETLARAFRTVRAGSAATVLVLGEAGIGKSRLVTEFTAGADDATVLVGACLDLCGDGLPFAPFTAVLRGLIERRGADAVVRLLPGGDAGELARLSPALGPVPPVGEFSRPRLFEQVLALLRALAEAGPVVLVVEDAHWADRSSRDLVNFLVHSQESVPGLLIVVVARDAALASLGRLPWTTVLELGRLTKGATRAQVRLALGGEPGSGLVERLHRRSEGNPLFTEALLACGDRPGPPVPSTVRDLLRAPLEDLPEPTCAVVRAVAAGGDRVNHALLLAVTGLGHAELSDAVRPAVTARLLVAEEDGYRFRHALAREAVYADLLPGDRALLHVRYGEALAKVTGGEGPHSELAQHWYAVRAAHPDRALRSCWQAAIAAREVLAHAERLRLLTRVLEIWPSVPDAASLVGADRDAVLEQAVEAAVVAGEVDSAESLLETALARADPVRTVRLLLHRSTVRQIGGRPGDIADLEEAARLAPEDDPLRATVLNALTERLLTVPREDEGLAVAEAARAAALAEPELTVAEINLAYARARAGDLDAELPHLVEARERAVRRGDDKSALHALRCESDVLQGAGRHEEAARVARLGIATATAAGLARSAGPTHAGNLAEALISLGSWDEATEIVDHAMELDPAPSLHAYLLVLSGSLSFARGDLTSAEHAAEFGNRILTGGTAYDQDLLQLVVLEVDLLMARGRRREAVAKARAALAPCTSPRYGWPLLVAGAAAAETTAEALDFAGRSDGLPVVGPVQEAYRSTLFALAGRADWAGAVRAWTDLRQPYPRARTHLHAAESALEAGDRAAAVALLGPARSTMDELGAESLRPSLERLERLANVRAPEPAGTPAARDVARHGLTPRELDVLRLLADGRSNRQIAEALFISVKTVGVHASSIFGKLGVTSRVQAATLAHRIGIVT